MAMSCLAHHYNSILNRESTKPYCSAQIATTQHALLQTRVDLYVCRKKIVPIPKLDSKSVPSACEAGALSCELLGSIKQVIQHLGSIVCLRRAKESSLDWHGVNNAGYMPQC